MFSSAAHMNSIWLSESGSVAVRPGVCVFGYVYVQICFPRARTALISFSFSVARERPARDSFGTV